MTRVADWPPAVAAARGTGVMPAGHACLLRLYNLRLPFRLQVVARRGRHRLAGERRGGVLAQGDTVAVAPYRTLHYEGATAIDPRVGYELHLVLHDERPPGLVPSRDAELGATAGPAGHARLAACVAYAVFREPARTWSVALAAEQMQMSARRLQAQLFREGNALTAIVREQRLMRALLAVLGSAAARGDLAHVAEQVGFASAARLDDAFDAHFGSSASRIARLAWYPALTWSIAGTAPASAWLREREVAAPAAAP